MNERATEMPEEAHLGQVAIDEPQTESSHADLQQEETFAFASQRQLIWRRFLKHKLALASLIVVVLIYMVALFAEFLAPYPPDTYSANYSYAPPQRLHVWEQTADGGRFRLYVHGFQTAFDNETLRRTFTVDKSQSYDVRLWARGEPYKLWGLIPWDRHLIGPVDDEAPMYLFGADRQGRDMLSRLIYGTRISMTIGLVGVFLSFVLGILLGGLSGYYGGFVDNIIQRLIEFLMSVPTLPLWMGLAAALPTTWGPLQVYFGITVILSIVGWTDLARVVRGRFLSLRTEDFVTAAELDGVNQWGIILRYMLPSFMSHVIASLTLAVPGMILAETALSFLGLGLQAPVVSWGVLLQSAQNVRAVATAPWLLIGPGVAVVVAVLALNFLGDGLRDAADPYSA